MRLCNHLNLWMFSGHAIATAVIASGRWSPWTKGGGHAVSMPADVLYALLQ